MVIRSKRSAAPEVTLDDVLSSFRACAPVFTALGDKYRQDIILLLAQDDP